MLIEYLPFRTSILKIYFINYGLICRSIVWFAPYIDENIMLIIFTYASWSDICTFLHLFLVRGTSKIS